MLAFNGMFYFGNVFSSQTRPTLHNFYTIFADVNVVRGVVGDVGISYVQTTQLQFIGGFFNARRYRDDILKTITLPFAAQINPSLPFIR